MGVAGLATLAEGIGNLVTGTAGPQPLTIDDLAGTLTDIKSAFLIIDHALKHADRESHLAVTAATDAATEAEAVGQNLNDITSHTYRIVIPGSLSWLAGYVVQTWIDPIRRELAGINKLVKFLMGWRGQIDSWRHTWVDPELKDWHGFHVWFKGYPIGVITRWHNYFLHPAEFGGWAAPFIVRPLVSWLLSPAHRVERDMLNLALVDSWQDDPNLIWDAVLRWVVKDS